MKKVEIHTSPLPKNTNSKYTEKLFSYGTLRYETVQLATFGRKLIGQEDVLSGYKLQPIAITNEYVIALSGENTHLILQATQNNTDTVLSMVFTVSAQELELADQYELADYTRIKVTLASSLSAWVYASTDK